MTAGRLTSQARMLPGVLIVGAQRCGTTSMYRTLSQHPAMLKAVLHKGVHYFDMNYDRGMGWYRAHFPLRVSGQRAARITGDPALTFESSPYYMFHPCAADRIASDLPDVKLLVLVRDPVERAYSAYAHEIARGFETESFERALELEGERLRGEVERMAADPAYLSHAHQHQAYRARGRYCEQLDRLERIFGAERIHVVDSGDFFAKPEPEYDAVLDYLGLRNHGYPEFERHNARPRSAMSSALSAELAAYFEPFDQRLTKWLGKIPSWRRLESAGWPWPAYVRR
ncbi:MAG: sulfotransferase family protein [Streptosporangiaceae bacterium]